LLCGQPFFLIFKTKTGKKGWPQGYLREGENVAKVAGSFAV
jgi:hypothetical protein